MLNSIKTGVWSSRESGLTRRCGGGMGTDRAWITQAQFGFLSGATLFRCQ